MLKRNPKNRRSTDSRFWVFICCIGLLGFCCCVGVFWNFVVVSVFWDFVVVVVVVVSHSIVIYASIRWYMCLMRWKKGQYNPKCDGCM